MDGIQKGVPFEDQSYGLNTKIGPLMNPPPTQKISVSSGYTKNAMNYSNQFFNPPNGFKPGYGSMEHPHQKMRPVYNIVSYPKEMSQPFNLYSFDNIFNPNLSHINSVSPLHIAALGLHPYLGTS